MDYKTALQNFHFFSRIYPELLPPEEKLLYNNAGTIVKYNKKEIIFKEGSLPRGAYIIIKGAVKVFQINSNGNEQILFFFSEGEIFGYRALLSNNMQPFTAGCLENCEIKFIDAKTFLFLTDTSVKFTRQLLTSLSHEFTILVNRINFFAQKGIRERLALALLLLNEKYKITGSKTDVSNIKISRTDLASYIGTSIDVASRNLKFYTENKYIRTEGKSIFINDFESLLKASGIV